jgi:DNA-binding IclR family transcriptional regulator
LEELLWDPVGGARCDQCVPPRCGHRDGLRHLPANAQTVTITTIMAEDLDDDSDSGTASARPLSPGIKPLLVLSKIRSILDAFTLAKPALSLTDLRTATGLPTSTVQRLAANLVAEGFLDRDGDRFRIGAMMAYWAAPASRGINMLRAVSPALRELRDITGETACFFIREGSFRVCVAMWETAHAIRREMHVGKVLPLHAGSAGRVLMAWDEGALREALSRPLTSFTKLTLVDPEALGGDVERVRRAGWSFTEGERDDGAAGLSAPVFDAQAVLAGAMTISGPTSRVTRRVADVWADDLVRSAETATRLLGGRPPY